MDTRGPNLDIPALNNEQSGLLAGDAQTIMATSFCPWSQFSPESILLCGPHACSHTHTHTQKNNANSRSCNFLLGMKPSSPPIVLHSRCPDVYLLCISLKKLRIDHKSTESSWTETALFYADLVPKSVGEQNSHCAFFFFSFHE